jgi:uncharacterized protein (TIGR03435 family)
MNRRIEGKVCSPLIVAGKLVFALSGLICQAGSGQQLIGFQSLDGRTTVPTFAVVSVRPNNLNDGRWRLKFVADGFSATGVTVEMLIREAYGIFETDRLSGAKGWVNSDRFDVEAKVDEGDVPALHRLEPGQRTMMLQAVLADRLKLKVHHESQELPVFVLSVAKNGPKFHETPPDHAPIGAADGGGATWTRSRPGQLTGEWVSMPHFATALSQRLDRPVEDETGLRGHYDLKLDWAPDEMAARSNTSANGTPATLEPAGPSIFTALQEQLGLKLKSKDGLVDVLVIDDVQKPSAN